VRHVRLRQKKPGHAKHGQGFWGAWGPSRSEGDRSITSPDGDNLKVLCDALMTEAAISFADLQPKP